MELYLDIRNKIENNAILQNHSYLIDNITTNHQIFSNQKSQNIESYIKELNSSLNSGNENLNALNQLILLLPQCPSDLIINNGEIWLRLCTTVSASAVHFLF